MFGSKKSPKESSVVTPVYALPTITTTRPQSDIENNVNASSGFNGTIATVPTATATAVPIDNSWAPVASGIVPDGEDNENNFEREKVLIGIHQMSRFVRIVALLGVAFIIVFALFSPIFCILIPFPLCGYFGARRWSYRLLFVYTMYLLLEIIGGIISAIYIPNTPFIVVRVIYIVFNIVIARYTTKICSYILVFEEADFEFLKNSPTIATIERGLLC